MKIVQGKTKPHGLRVVIYGVHGIGKTTLASKLHNALFLDYEDGTHGIDVAKVDTSDLPRSFSAFNGCMEEFRRNKQGFENLLIDSADKMEEIFDHAYSSKLEKPIESVFSVNDYGRTVSGFTAQFSRLLDNASKLVESGMNIVFLAHEQSRKVEPLEGTGNYDHHELKLSKANTKLLMQWADVVIFCAYKTFAVKDDETKKNHAGGGKRWCFTTHTNDWEAKHRASIVLPDDCSLDKMAELLPKALEDAVDTSNSEPSSVAPSTPRNSVAKKPTKPQEAPKADNEPTGNPLQTELRKLLNQYGITEEQLQKYATKFNDRYGIDFGTTPIIEWNDDFVAFLNRGMDKISAKIK